MMPAPSEANRWSSIRESCRRRRARIRIVQISDVHVGTIIRGGYLADILRKVREAKPDLLISTGDLVDGQGNDLTEAAAQLREIRPVTGNSPITGNHEFYAGMDKALEFTKKAGFTLLRGRVATVDGAGSIWPASMIRRFSGP